MPEPPSTDEALESLGWPAEAARDPQMMAELGKELLSRVPPSGTLVDRERGTPLPADVVAQLLGAQSLAMALDRLGWPEAEQYTPWQLMAIGTTLAEICRVEMASQGTEAGDKTAAELAEVVARARAELGLA